MTVAGGFGFPGAPGAMPGGVPGAPASPFGAAPMMPGAPGGAPQQPSGSAVQGFVLVIPADPTWEPMEFSDVLEKDGYYCVKVLSDQAKMIKDKLQVVVVLEIQDPDAVGKKVSRFLPDPRTTQGNTWFLWRGLILSIWGTIEQARAGFTYHPGMFTGHTAYVKTEAYLDKEGAMRTGVGTWETKAVWEAAIAAGPAKSRWPARVAAAPAGGGVGALPAGLPGGFPGGGLGGALPPAPGGAGMPTMPAPTTPQPVAAPMVQAAPPAAGFPPPPAAAPAPTAFAPPPAPAPAQAGFGFPPAPQFAAPAPQPVNGAAPTTPQPTAASLVGGFPGMPPK